MAAVGKSSAVDVDGESNQALPAKGRNKQKFDKGNIPPVIPFGINHSRAAVQSTVFPVRVQTSDCAGTYKYT